MPSILSLPSFLVTSTHLSEGKNAKKVPKIFMKLLDLRCATTSNICVYLYYTDHSEKMRVDVITRKVLLSRLCIYTVDASVS